MFEIFKELDVFRKIQFDEESHTYYCNNNVLTSTTTILSQYKEPFDTKNIAEKYALKHNLEVDEVIKEWDDKRISSAQKGTLLHRYLELKFASKMFTTDDELFSDGLKRIADLFYNDVEGKLIPIRAELVIGDEDFGIGGMIDKLFYNASVNEIQIWDYKTNKEISTYNKYKKRMINGLEHLHECEFNTYSLQLGVYKKIIEKNTNLKLGNSYICWMNENNETYKTFQTKDMSKEVGLILGNRLNEHIISIF